MATVKIKGSNENEEYTIEIDDIFIQKLNTPDDVIKFINGMVDLVKEQTKLKSLSVLEKQTDCIANKIAVILNGITETVRVLQTGNIFSIKPDPNFDPDKRAQISSEIKYSKDFCDISEDQKKQKLLMKEKRRRVW